MKNRCSWCEDTFEEYIRYHDEEWGVPVHDDRTHFEFLTLESAQAGLSWSTILKKRQGYRQAFANFKVREVAEFDESNVQKLLNNPAIVRNKLKIRSAINNARRFLEVQEAFGSFDQYIWSFVDGTPIQNNWTTLEEVPATTELSDTFSKDLKQRGFKFVGSTTMYAHLQAAGLVNDHLVSCFRYAQVKEMA
ncbi:DNA-3-methyladenine glycosylase I [Fodinibius sediminis]|uniref:DNA-3-methyladenine glycosylase I n=1 Tax=Fodinibius sediminis TaxID=1214077 RepID=A0A521DW81_9BACT|nr:DNA-3-methyladenine glycosylase I [Fodinibius sediminis]SMO75973.1 DNA-3-methyladenine glycosylase I [Fodinibius sediminis]